MKHLRQEAGKKLSKTAQGIYHSKDLVKPLLPRLYAGRTGVDVGKMQRDKGARFERMVAGLFKDWGYQTFRTAQYCGKSGDAADVEGAPGLHIECKHCERMTLYDWMAQAVRDTKAEKKNNKPVVIHKANNKPILVTMLLDDWMELYREWEAGRGNL